VHNSCIIAFTIKSSNHHINYLAEGLANIVLNVLKVNFEIYIADRKATTCIGKAISAPLC